ncbi:aldo/keto reductase [Bacillus carboniphilus]|uniref:Aldo/keto reductase n=1 Tax=Bacillus carboniphilus TaxID=86663 RepID=A0ABY9JYF9_9BACI|nr:aldo/keto reductase [Bacillus carboniphilus]WLR43814.1 aldo/keto reductase [Bacillus carboniphilus]
MKKRQLGSSDLYVSEIGLGCMSLGTEEKKARSIIDEAIDRGINYLDTADLYDYGLNESIVGKSIRHQREQIVLATKIGNHWEEGKEGWFWDPSRKYLKEAVKNSLHRLQTDYIDLLQLHGGTIEDPIDEMIETFEELKKEGYIRYFGISSIRPNVIKRFLNQSSVVSVMMQYSLLDRRPEEWFNLIQEHQVSVIARGPLAKGLLTNRPLSQVSQKMRENGYLDYSIDELESLLLQISEVASDLTLNQKALQYILSNEVVGTVVPGASTIEQVRDNLKVERELTKEEYKMLQSITKSNIYQQHRT